LLWWCPLFVLFEAAFGVDEVVCPFLGGEGRELGVIKKDVFIKVDIRLGWR